MVSAQYLKPIIPLETVAQVSQQQHSAKFQSGLTIKFDDSSFDSETGVYKFTGHVEAQYGPTIIHADSLELNSRDKTGLATGAVTLSDPEGFAKGTRLEFNWEAGTGSLEQVKLQADNVHIEAEKMQVQPGQWVLQHAMACLSRTGQSNVEFSADSVTISPGKSGVARRVFFHVFGSKIGPIPRLAFQLRKRLKGFGLPSVTNRKGIGVGVSWDANFAIQDHAVLGSFFDVFPKREPGFGLLYGYSPLGPEAATQIAPRGDLSERFADGWFNNISVRTPDEERYEIGSQRHSLGVGSFWNQGTTGRPKDFDNVSKVFDFSLDYGGQFGQFPALTSTHLQRVRESTTESFVSRLTNYTSALAPIYKISNSISGHFRADSFMSLSEKATYAWGRLETGLIYQPSQSLTVGLGYALGSGIGNQDFAFDGLVAGSMFAMRADYKMGPWTFRFLNKFNMDTRQWFDREYEISLVARELEPFLVYRQFPSETRIGVRFRIDNLRDRLTRRSQNR